jgi:hypothetical protein
MVMNVLYQDHHIRAPNPKALRRCRCRTVAVAAVVAFQVMLHRDISGGQRFIQKRVREAHPIICCIGGADIDGSSVGAAISELFIGLAIGLVLSGYLSQLTY